MPDCGHLFHATCAAMAFLKTKPVCPLCRREGPAAARAHAYFLTRGEVVEEEESKASPSVLFRLEPPYFPLNTASVSEIQRQVAERSWVGVGTCLCSGATHTKRKARDVLMANGALLMYYARGGGFIYKSFTHALSTSHLRSIPHPPMGEAAMALLPSLCDG